MTDAGLFERMATAVLRLADARYKSLAHPGINADGKTVKSPLDGITFLPGAGRPHMIAAHHTLSDQANLRGKWLHDPAKAKPRHDNKSTRPSGDVVKTLAIFKQQAARQQGLEGTLVLATIQEPSEKLVRDVNAFLSNTGLAVDIWSRSRLADFLDHNPSGQWLRRQYLRIEQEQLSAELLQELSRKSLEIRRPQGAPALWVARELDRRLGETQKDDVTFVVAESGHGKSVACFKQLSDYIAHGGFGLVMPHEAIEAAYSLDSAIENVLRQLHPSLAPGSGSAVRGFCSAHRPFLLVVEDVSKSGRGADLLEKITGWSTQRPDDHSRWRILCPTQPKLLLALSEEARKSVGARAISIGGFLPHEGRQAVLLRSKQTGLSLTDLEAERISIALGHDPLLIALHDLASPADPAVTVERYVDGRLGAIASERPLTVTEGREALRALAREMLGRRMLDLSWQQVRDWLEPGASYGHAIREIMRQGGVLHLSGADEQLVFRHDRVRQFLLVDAMRETLRTGKLSGSLRRDPFFSEVLGTALARENVSQEQVDQVAQDNPLALFFGLKDFGEPKTVTQAAILQAIDAWIVMPEARSTSFRHCRWHALLALEETDSTRVLDLCRKFPREDWLSNRVKFRQGDLAGGIQYFLAFEPGVGVLGQEQLLNHVRARHGHTLAGEVSALLHNKSLDARVRVGALRLAGQLLDPSLAEALAASWALDPLRGDNLDAYLFACGRCAGSDAASILDPVCDAWAALPSQRDDGLPSPRDNLAAHNVKWAFREALPEDSLRYFIERANRDTTLRWPITYMLDGVDHPDALAFIAHEVAEQSRRGDTAFSLTAGDEWRRKQERTGEPMSAASRERLRELWQPSGSDEYLRKQALRLWAASSGHSDSTILRDVPESDALGDFALWHRLRLGDETAIPAMIRRIGETDPTFWWQLGRHVWSDDLTAVLDKALHRRSEKAEAWDFGDTHTPDYLFSEFLMALPTLVAEELLLRHWGHIRHTHYYVQAALYIATPNLRQLAAECVTECPARARLFEHLLIHFGHKVHGRRGIYRIEQLETIAPYIEYLRPHDIGYLWDLCNERGWFAYRKAHLDLRISNEWRNSIYLDRSKCLASLDEMQGERTAHWIDHWVDSFLETGTPREEIVGILAEWLSEKTDLNALEMVSRALVHFGRRSDLPVLQRSPVNKMEDAAALIADTTFAVMRRSPV